MIKHFLKDNGKASRFLDKTSTTVNSSVHKVMVPPST